MIVLERTIAGGLGVSEKHLRTWHKEHRVLDIGYTHRISLMWSVNNNWRKAHRIRSTCPVS